MKILTYLTFGLVLGTQVGRVTTSQRPSAPSAESIDVGGIELRLGMSKAEVLSRIADKGYASGTGDGVNLPILEGHGKGQASSLLGLVSFENNRLTFINRVWTPDNDNGPAIARGLYGVFSDAQRQGRTVCTMSTDSRQSPSADIKEVSFTCGQSRKVIFLQLTHYQEQDFVSVSETLKSD